MKIKNIFAVAVIALLSGCTSFDFGGADITLTDAEMRAIEVVETMPSELWEVVDVRAKPRPVRVVDARAKPRPVIAPMGEPAPEIITVEVEDQSLPVVIEVATEKLAEPFLLKEVNYSEEQLYCLAVNIYFEARSESTAGMMAVGLVTMNRTASNKYPNTICKVVWQRKQFSWTHDGQSDTPQNRRAWIKSVKIAELVMSEYRTKDYDFTSGALWYHADYVRPSWSAKSKPSTRIGAHIFYAKL